MKRTILTISMMAASLALVACGTTSGRDGDARGGHRGHGDFEAMRQASAAACEGKTEGAQVSLTNPRGTVISAVCTKTPKGQLHAMPEQMAAHMKVAQQACVGKSSGDVVQIPNFRDAGKTMDATCTQRDGVLIARPQNMKKWGHKKNDAFMGAPATSQ